MSYQSATTRSRLVVVGLALWLVSAIALVIVNLLRLDLVNRIASGQSVSFDEATSSDNLVTGVARVGVGVYLLTAIFVLIWLHRVVRNNHASGERYLRFSPAWAVGCWFVPFLNFVVPYQAVREAWGGSDPELPWSTPDTRRRSRGSPLIAVWWLTFIGGSLVGLAAIGFGPNSGIDPLTRVRAITYITIVQEAIELAAALLVIAIVARLTARQDQKSEAMMRAALAAPSPSGSLAPAMAGPGFIPPGFAQQAGMTPPQPPAAPPPPPPPPAA